MKTLLATLCLLLAGCATMSSTPCGDPCASMPCPSAFVCSVDGRCVAHCQPEPVKPGL